MPEPFEWESGFFSANTSEFDRALRQLRRAEATSTIAPSAICNLAKRLLNQPAITRREFDRRFRLIVTTAMAGDAKRLWETADLIRLQAPDALNAFRTLLPADMRHIATLPRLDQQPSVGTKPIAPPDFLPPMSPIGDAAHSAVAGRYRAVGLVGTHDEHFRNETLLKNAKLDHLRLTNLSQLWDVAATGLCGFVVGGSVWGQIPAEEQSQVIRRICEHSTFIYVRVCLDGLSQEIAQCFPAHAAEVRCGQLDMKKICHGTGCDLTHADIALLLDSASLLEAAGTADFFPLGLTEPEASLLRLISVDRRNPNRALSIRRLGTRELAGGRSGARVFLLSDENSQPFVAKVDRAEALLSEIRRHQEWIQDWETSVTSPRFHTHGGHAALTYRLQPSPDRNGSPAPTLEDRLEQLRLSEWTKPLEDTIQEANDLFQGISRAIDQLIILNSGSANGTSGEDFWLHWPVYDLADRGIDCHLVDMEWQGHGLEKIVKVAISLLTPNFQRGIVHGDIHGRNILLIDRLPAFIDFASSGPGHPLVDLVRLDATVRAGAMRMMLDKRSMHDMFHEIYIDGYPAEPILLRYPTIAASPLTSLAIRTATKVREAALSVARAHSLDQPDYLAMQAVVSAHLLVNRTLGSGIERLILSIVGPRILATRT